MGFNEYFAFLDRLSTMDIPVGESMAYCLSKLLDSNDEEAQAAVAFRANFMGSRENNITNGYLVIGHFTAYDDNLRHACICIILEAEYHRKILGLRTQCAPYSLEQPLFRKIPTLYTYVRDKELIEYSVLKRIAKSEIISFGNKFGYLNKFVPLSLLNWKDENRPEAPLYIKVDPYQVFDTQPQQSIQDSVVIPPNPKWWQNLEIYKGQHEGCSFLLNKNVDPKENPLEYWEYHCRHIRRLDVVAKRNGNGNLSMMLEELEESTNLLSPTERIIIGRMIHLDTDALFDSPFADATLNHLDLAINVYMDQNAENRLNDNLAKGGRVEDATFRTHLLRVEQIPFEDLFPFTYCFLQSNRLWAE